MQQYKNRVLNVNEPVEFYRCLNRKGFIFSIRQDGKVVGHTDKIILKDCDLIINKSGKDRCIRTQSRNVHAFIRGYIGTIDDIQNSPSFILNYNPYEDISFNIQGSEVNKAKTVYIQGRAILCQQ